MIDLTIARVNVHEKVIDLHWQWKDNIQFLVSNIYFSWSIRNKQKLGFSRISNLFYKIFYLMTFANGIFLLQKLLYTLLFNFWLEALTLW